VCSHVGPSSMYDTRQLGLPSRDGQGIALVRRTGVLASGKYYGRHLKKFKLRYLRGGSSDSDLLRVWFQDGIFGVDGSNSAISRFAKFNRYEGKKQCARSN